MTTQACVATSLTPECVKSVFARYPSLDRHRVLTTGGATAGLNTGSTWRLMPETSHLFLTAHDTACTTPENSP